MNRDRSASFKQILNSELRCSPLIKKVTSNLVFGVSLFGCESNNANENFETNRKPREHLLLKDSHSTVNSLLRLEANKLCINSNSPLRNIMMNCNSVEPP